MLCYETAFWKLKEIFTASPLISFIVIQNFEGRLMSYTIVYMGMGVCVNMYTFPPSKAIYLAELSAKMNF